MPPGSLTTTSYTVLGLLALRTWTTYELVGQTQRTIRYFWPRAESKVYEEPKKLAARGYARATRDSTGRRPRTLYTITPAGRRALAAWLSEPGRGPVVEFDGLVKVLFAEQGTKSHLLATIRAIREQADLTRDAHREIAAELADTGGPFPERLAVNALVFRFLWEQAAMLERWAEWAERQVSGWPPDVSAAPTRVARRLFLEAASG